MSAGVSVGASVSQGTPPADRALMREEHAIAKRYMGRVPWEMVAWGLGNFALWLSLWPWLW